ncbi:MAG TPA: cation diffusion facilitator family transporter [Bryobacteraceae bacterium]|nr:cation diffusion facilitator family transporter [Bryobacteraceae bacterium]
MTNSARRIAITGMIMSGLLAIMKLTIGWLAHSAALSADGFESTADVFASGTVLAALTLAERPADENHPYGHGRAETLAGLLLGFLLMVAGWAIAWHGLAGAADEKRVPEAYAIWPLVISIGVKFGLVAVKSRKAREIGSASLRADATNDSIDMLSGIVALVALSLARYDPVRFLHADHYGAFLIGLIVIVTSLRIMYDSAMHLMDTMPDAGAMMQIRQVALRVPEVAGVEKCFARKTGLKYHVDLHLEVDPEITVRRSHEIATNVRIAIKDALPWVADVLVHVEPAPN